uniref:Uncharacterized protein n=1 Tax=Arundo donax TaxID=35708 RepID=A0A0A9CKF0_ARUDO
MQLKCNFPPCVSFHSSYHFDHKLIQSLEAPSLRVPDKLLHLHSTYPPFYSYDVCETNFFSDGQCKYLVQTECSYYNSSLLDSTNYCMCTSGRFLMAGSLWAGITHGSLLGEGQSATINSSCEANRNEGLLTDETATHVPFVKRLFPVWSTIEKMEVFKKVPQRPHFGPLEEKLRGLREGMALCLMVSFANVVESIRESSIEDSDESFEEMDNILSLLKDNGFDVDNLQACLKKLIWTKSEYAKHLEEKDVLQEQKLLKGTCCSRVNSLLAKKMEAVVELEEKLGHLRREVQQLAEEKERGDEELSELETAESMVNKACYDIEKQFRDALAEHLG